MAAPGGSRNQKWSIEMRTILAISALTLAMAGAAHAQTTGSTTPPDNQNLDSAQESVNPETWNGPIADAFFIDGRVRPEAEIRTNWAMLTAEQQATVRLDCDGEMQLSEAAQQACNMVRGM